MERIRIRPLALAAIMGAVALVPMFGSSALASSSSRPNEVAFSRGLANVQVLPSLLPNSKENTSIVAQNDGTAAATIVMDIYTPAGVLIPSASVPFANVPPGGTRVFAQATNTGLTPGFRGVGVISSDQPVNTLEVRDIQENGTGIDSYDIHAVSTAGAMKVALPYVSNALENTFNTRFAIANTSTTQACVTIQYVFPGGAKSPVSDNGPGGGGCTTGYAIPVNGQISFAPTAIDGAIHMPASTNNSIMAATITSTAPVTVSVDAYLTGAHKLGSYDGFAVDADPTKSDLGTTVLIPVAAKLDGFYTQILLSNPGATDAHATITYKDQNTGTTYPVSLTVPAAGTANHSVYDTAGNIPEGFVGSAVVTSDQPLAAVVFRSQMTAPGSFIDLDTYTAAKGIPVGRATTTAKVPLIFRRAYSAGSNFGYNTWVNVTVADGGTANVTLTSINDTTNAAPGCSAAATFTTTKQVNGSFIFYQNADTDTGFGPNPPACFWGGMTITSDKPIIAVANATNDLNVGDNDGLFNAFSN